MAAAQQAARLGTRRVEHARSSGIFDWVMVGLLGVLLAGVVLDGWAHTHDRVDGTFFTPWHAVFYSGFALVAGALGSVLVLNYRRGTLGRRAIPAGYEYAYAGAAVFAVGGVFDLLWHTIFGIEVNIEAALSPSHLMLVLGMSLLFWAPLRAAWYRRDRPVGLFAHLPLLLSLTCTLTILSFITQYAHPYMEIRAGSWSGGQAGQAIGIASILLQTALLMGFVLHALRRWDLPFGSWALVLTLNALLLSFIGDHYRTILVALVAGLAADALTAVLHPSTDRAFHLRLFAFVVPVIWFSCYFVMVARTGGIVWSIHAWMGTIFLAGSVGWLLSCLVVPPRLPLQPTPPES